MEGSLHIVKKSTEALIVAGW